MNHVDNSEGRRSNPLNLVAFIAILTIVGDIYKITTTHEMDWFSGIRISLLGIFVFFYCTRSRYAWLVGFIFLVALTPVYLFINFFSKSQLPKGGGFLILAGIMVAGVYYLISIREQYYSFLRQHQTDS